MNDGVLILLAISAGVFSLILEEQGINFQDAIMITIVIFCGIGFGIGYIYGF